MRKSKSAAGTAALAKKTDPSQIVQAAIACIERLGTHNTGVAEVAKAAGVGRQTVYRAFATRRHLLEAIIAARLSEMARRLEPIVSRYQTLEKAIIFGSIKSVAVARSDAIYWSVLNEIDHLGAERYMVSPASPMAAFMLLVWHRALGAARMRGELREDFTDIEIINWLQGVHLLLFIREDLKPRKAVNLMKAFVMPGLVRDSGTASRKRFSERTPLRAA